MNALDALCPDCGKWYKLGTFACGSVGHRCKHCGSIGTPKNWLSGYFGGGDMVASMMLHANLSPPLQSVDDYNASKRKEREERERRNKQTGVACPKCGKELEWESDYAPWKTLPISKTRGARCRPCLLTISLEV